MSRWTGLIFLGLITVAAMLLHIAFELIGWRAHVSIWVEAVIIGSAVGIAGTLYVLISGINEAQFWRDLAAMVNGTTTAQGPNDVAGRSRGGLMRGSDEFLAAVKQVRSELADGQEKLRSAEIIHRITEVERGQLQNVLDVIPDAVLVTDAFDEILLVNQQFSKLFDRDTHEAIHKPVEYLIPDPQIKDEIRRVRGATSSSESRRFEWTHQGEEHISYAVTMSLIRNERTSSVSVVTVMHDLSRERELSQLKSDFVSKASHELRTPLSAIRGYVEMLVDGEIEQPEDANELYRVIQDEADRLNRMIDNMLNISRIEAGIVQIDRADVDIKPLVEKAADALRGAAAEKSIALTIDCAPVDLHVEGDQDMLYQVLLNLGSNAIKYTPEGGRVTLSADTDNLTRSLVISVSDTGLGISPDDIPKLFEKFYRIENYKRIAKGTGLGLNLCKHIVETIHQGQIGVDSKLGMGSRFWFTLPTRFTKVNAAA